ncbi:unnamed protein product [Phaedon cochleariae]|uniref:Essential protein Yae1 N-terminal domain-containing protein n=1 Tax=Phaedon cochleariae TaxID=80249 RepID=A0A9P0GP63_PHACE|nr:unnamed protein product [Phaedon cochleariae]
METQELSDIEQDWKKVENSSRQTGLRDGISDGRDSNYQKSFDTGFQEGFKNGFLLGKHKGILLAESQQTSTEIKTNPLLEKLSRGSCEVCKSGKSLDEEDNIEKLVAIQKKVYEENVRTLASISNEESGGF